MLDTPFDLHSHAQHYHKVAVNSKEAEDQKHLDEVKVLAQNLPPERKLYKDHLSRIVSNKCSAWLSVNPWEDEYFFMPPDEFRDSMSCRYGKTPKGLQAWCDGCGEAFDANHALDCKNGGLVHQRHNEMRNENCDLNKKAGLSQVLCEPVIREADQNGVGGLKGDWSVRGFWVPQRVAVFDTRIFNKTPLLIRTYLWMLLSIFTEMKRKTNIQLRLNKKEDPLHPSLQLVKEF